MLKFLLGIVLALAVSGHAAAEDINERIAGGVNAAIADFPHQLSLRRNGVHVCGASVIGNYWAITAAHCILRTSASQFSLHGGNADRNLGLLFNVTATYLHPNFNGVTLENNVALLRTQTPLTGDNVSAIELDIQATMVPDGTSANATGWGVAQIGSDASQLLQRITLEVMSAERCDVALSAYGGIAQSTICATAAAAGTGICYGDDGGPIVANGLLVGVVSWSVNCGAPHVPTVLTRIAAISVRSFIRSMTGI